MGGVGSGGARLGSGPRRKSLEQHLISALRRAASRLAAAGPLRVDVGRIGMCLACGSYFTRRSRESRCCNVECGKVYSARQAKARSLPRNEAKRRRRARERLAGIRRYAAGGNDARANRGRWRRICARDGWKCWICKEDIDCNISPPHRLAGSGDHVIPIVNGGSDDDSNLRAAHISCNARRGAARFTPTVAA